MGSHLFCLRRQDVWHEGAAGGNPRQSAQLHPIPRGLQSAEGRSSPTYRKGQQGEHRLQPFTRQGFALQGSHHPELLRHQSHQDPVAAKHRS